jgi:uncharacterized membrane protein
MATASNSPRTRHKPQNVNQQHEATLSVQDRLALLITSAVGTMYAVYFFIVALAGWMLWQGAVSDKPFDPYPFAFLLFMGNIVQLLLMPLIMVGQNIQGRHAQLRSDEEYKTMLSSYHDVEEVMRRLETQEELLQRQSQMIEQLLRARK